MYTSTTVNLKVIFPLLFFEHGYLAYYKPCMCQLLTMHEQHSYQRSMSQIFSLGPGFDFMTKNGKLLIFFAFSFKIPSST